MSFYCYLARCSGNSLYCGSCKDLAVREATHNAGRGAKYTRSRRPVRMVYSEEFPTRAEAMRREARVKRLGKEEKERLVAGKMRDAAFTHWRSPLGWIRIEATERGIRRVTFRRKPPKACARRPALHRRIEARSRRSPRAAAQQARRDALSFDATTLLYACMRQLQEYFAGSRRTFDLPLDLPCTPFRKQVWDEAARIPAGGTRTYGEIAKRIGHPGAVRAVGTTLKANPACLLIPCHRVIPASGKTGAYAGGAAKKAWLLRQERDSFLVPRGTAATHPCSSGQRIGDRRVDAPCSAWG